MGWFPAFNGTMERSDSSQSIPPPRSARQAVLRRDDLFAPGGGVIDATVLGRVRISAGPTRCFGAETGGLPGSWSALVHVLRSSIPMGPTRPTTRRVGVVFRAYQGVDTHKLNFRDSITRPMHFLCTLHLVGRPTRRNTRFRLVVSLDRTGLSPVGLH